MKKNAISLIVGSALTLVLCLIWIGIVPANPTYRYSGIVAIVLIVFIAGLKKVPVQHEEVVEFLGARSKLRFKEGFIWLPVFFSDTEDVSTKDMVIDVPPIKVFTKDKVEVIVDIWIWLKVVNPILFLNLENPNETIKQSTISKCNESSWEEIKGLTYNQCLSCKENIQNAIKAKMAKEESELGVEITNIDIRPIVPAEEVRKELAEDKKKELRTTRFAKDLKKIAKEVPNISDKEKVDTVEVVEGIVKKELKTQQTTMKVGVETETIKTVAEIIAMFLPKKKTDETKPEKGDRK